MYKDCYFRLINNLINYSLSKIDLNSEEIPVFALLLNNFNIIDETNNILDKHAEIILLERNNVKNLDILVTLEPCPACLFLMYKKGIKNVFFGGFNYQYGSSGGKFHLNKNIKMFNFNIFGGFQKEKIEIIIKKYFQNMR